MDEIALAKSDKKKKIIGFILVMIAALLYVTSMGNDIPISPGTSAILAFILLISGILILIVSIPKRRRMTI